MSPRYWLAGASLALLLAVPAQARAEVWGYVDAQGVAHFSTEKVDERYELFFRGDESFDTSCLGKAPRGNVDTARAVAVLAFLFAPKTGPVVLLFAAVMARGIGY